MSHLVSEEGFEIPTSAFQPGMFKGKHETWGIKMFLQIR